MSPNRYYGWRILIACFIITLYVGGTVTYGFTAFFEPIQRDFHWSYTQISLASSLRGLEMGIARSLFPGGGNRQAKTAEAKPRGKPKTKR